MTTRRQFLGTTLLASTAFAHFAQAAPKSSGMLMRPIPSSGEKVPAIGMGTSGSFQIPADSAEYEALKEVVKRFFDGGATLIDTAPTYGNAEDNLGPLLTEGGYRKKAFIATKLSGVTGRDAGLAQFNNTLAAAQDRQGRAACRSTTCATGKRSSKWRASSRNRAR